MPFTVTTMLARLLDLGSERAGEARTDAILASFVYDDYLTLSAGREVGFLAKPSAKRLVDALLNSSTKRMRGLLHGGEMIWWEPRADVTCKEIAKCCGYVDLKQNHFWAILTGHEVHVEYDEEFWDYASLKRRLQLRQLIESADMYFYVDALGWVAGPEWAEINEDEAGNVEWMNVQRTKPTANIIASSPAKTPASLESELRDTQMSPLSLLITMRS